MEIRLIKTEADYEAALKEIERLFDAEPDTPEGDALETWAILVEAYEKEHYRIPLPDPISAIEYYVESRGLSRQDLEPYIGSRARVSEILNRKRPLTLRMIRNLEKGLGIPAAILVQEYELVQSSQLETYEEASLLSFNGWASQKSTATLPQVLVSTYNPAESEYLYDEPIPAPEWMIPANYARIAENTTA